MSRLCVMDDVTWDGTPVPGERTHALLRALVDAGSRGLSEDALVEEIWADDVPANPAKALQVVVSRARSATSSGTIERTARGYRLALATHDVDAWALQPEALRLAAEGRYDEALPLLERASARTDGSTPAAGVADDRVVGALLRAVAAVHGVPSALERYETYRAELADRLGVDPSPELRTLHAELLARDRPVREGLLYDATPLIGRDHDVAELSAMIRSARVTSIVGAGGLGKTRLAQLMARLAEQPVVHFVELAGVTSPEGVTVEVGDVLGVRESVTGRMPAAARRTDLIGRILDQLGAAPSLLVLDNCEHLVEAVADLVAVLVARTPSVTVLTTSRAPLGIAAERVYQLPELGLDDAVELFIERATATRAGARLDPDEIRSVVRRLEGLPLAVELAAAKVRVMSVAEIGRRLENRFELLRGGSRDAPERHQTLLAVIDWSWNLLADSERAALRRLAVFRDGFSLEGADAVIDGHALTALSSLVDQSLVAVQEGRAGLRYRMLETVREFGQMHLVDAGDDQETADRLRRWGMEFCLRAEERLFGPRQVATMSEVRVEEGNLVDLLRRCLRAEDVDGVVVLMACLSDFWTIEGSHLKVINLGRDVETLVADARVEEAHLPALRTTLSAIAFNSMIFSDRGTGRALDRLERLGEADLARSSAVATILLAVDRDAGRHQLDAIDRLCEDPRREVAQVALQWASQVHENQGDLVGAHERARRALELVDDRYGPWSRALVHAQLAGLTMQVGRMDAALEHAKAALPVMEALGASEDAAQLKAVLAVAAMEERRFDDAERIFDEIAEDDAAAGVLGGAVILLCGRSELDLARGRVEEGLRGYRDAAHILATRPLPGIGEVLGYEPWVLYPQAAALSAHIRHGHRDDGAALHRQLLASAPVALGAEESHLDYPVAGAVVFALAQWELADDPGTDAAERAVRLLACAERFGYNRQLPSLSWDVALELAETVLPGAVARNRVELEGRTAAGLRDDVRRLVAELGH